MTSVSYINFSKTAPACPNKNALNKKQQAMPEEDCLSISDKSLLLTSAEAIAQAETDIDQDKVDRIKQAIKNGELTIDYEKLAQKMLDFEFSLS